MPTFNSNGVHINYTIDGDGPPIVLVHGFAASIDLNWRGPGIIDALVAAGRKVIALDVRGFGKSGKPHDSAAYAGSAMQDDVIGLMDHLGIEKADLMGYSMGGFISSALMTTRPERFTTVILAGIGDAIVTGWNNPARSSELADAMDSPDGSARTEQARNFRIYAERTGNDLEALAAMQRAPRNWSGNTGLGETKLPVLIIVGEQDALVGSGDKLAAAIPGSKYVKVPGDHLSAVAKPELKAAIIDFLKECSPA